MRIGIVTHWDDTDNYGAALQSYALQCYFRNKGHEAFVIRYYPSKENLTIFNKLLFHLKNPLSVFNRNKRRILKSKIKQWDALRDFNSFRKEYVSFSENEYKGFGALREHFPHADMYVTGSDQVWHGSLKNVENRAYFLDFGKDDTIRISYAASFGRNYFPCVDETLFKSLLSRFDLISMREDSGVKIVKERGFKAVRCLDSTLLLSGNHYKTLMAPQKHNCDYVYFYTVNVTSSDEIFWRKFQSLFNNRGLKCIVTTGSGYKEADEIFENCEYDYSTVQEWLSNIYYSKLFVTASFHGVVFSYLLHKDFIYLPLHSKYASGNNRVTDFLQSIGLMERMANNWTEVNKLVEKKIDYSRIDNSHFLALYQHSVEYLDKAIKIRK